MRGQTLKVLGCNKSCTYSGVGGWGDDSLKSNGYTVHRWGISYLNSVDLDTVGTLPR